MNEQPRTVEIRYPRKWYQRALWCLLCYVSLRAGVSGWYPCVDEYGRPCWIQFNRTRNTET